MNVLCYLIFLCPPDDMGGGGGVREGGEEGEEGEGGGWDVDDDLDIPEDIGDVGPATSGEDGYFVPPTKGSAPSQVVFVCRIATLSPVQCVHTVQYAFEICVCICYVHLQVWATKSQLPGDSVAAGAFENAMRVSSAVHDNISNQISNQISTINYVLTFTAFAALFECADWVRHLTIFVLCP